MYCSLFWWQFCYFTVRVSVLVWSSPKQNLWHGRRGSSLTGSGPSRQSEGLGRMGQRKARPGRMCSGAGCCIRQRGPILQGSLWRTTYNTSQHSLLLGWKRSLANHLIHISIGWRLPPGALNSDMSGNTQEKLKLQHVGEILGSEGWEVRCWSCPRRCWGDVTGHTKHLYSRASKLLYWSSKEKQVSYWESML